VLLLVVVQGSVALEAAYGVQALLVLFFLRQLAGSQNPRHDEAFVSAIAILGRGCVAVLLAHYAFVGKGPLLSMLFLAGLTGMSLLFAWAMAQSGPVTGLYAPAWLVGSVTVERAEVRAS
jgi:hypothetical protein